MAPSVSLAQSADDYQAANVFDSLSLCGRVVVITGGAKGIGLALGFAVAEAGASVAIVDAAPEPDQAFTKLQELSPKVGYYQLQETFALVAGDFDRVDGLYVILAGASVLIKVHNRNRR
ncbi:hypothetical protein FDECE_12878 [Fusarium decemcellulare]|nr:hypothetical protein FDECE_12878 [Fusarium decemcellulare]